MLLSPITRNLPWLLGQYNHEYNQPIEQHALKNVNNDLNTKIYSYSETSGGQSSNTYLNVDHFFNTGVN